MCKASLNHRKKGSLAFLLVFDVVKILWQTGCAEKWAGGLFQSDYAPLMREQHRVKIIYPSAPKKKKKTIMEFVVYIIMNILKFSMCFIG